MEVSDVYLKEKWKMTEANVKSEIMTVVQLFEMCNMFKVDLDRQEDKSRRESEINNNILMRDFKPNEPIKSKNSNNIKHQNSCNSQNSNQYVSNPENKININNRWEHFGGKPPFQYLNERDEDNNMAYENERYIKARSNSNHPPENAVVYKKPVSSEKKDKDPLVWDPPDDKKKIQAPQLNQNLNLNKNQKISNQANKNQKKVENKVPIDAEKRRNYEKPWKLPEEKKNNQNKEKEKENKSSFLLHCYPDGQGPDSELIEMLEREVVDTNPNVKFEDIAELDKAKNVLKEAVLLPLLMPDYFKVKLVLHLGNQKTLERSFTLRSTWNW
jgi:katanin p60 ATPase-containing subunit A1